MKSIKLKNFEVVPVHNFLAKVELTGQASRGRSKFIKRLGEKNKEFAEDLEELQKQYFKVDENGSFITDSEQKLIYKDENQKDEAVEQMQALNSELVEISFAEYSKKFEAMFKELDEYDKPMSNLDADAYDTLMTAYEEENK